ncbi:DUF3624 domain-containing protein [Vibrio sp. SCSIO 43136]|uniref:DUF3624 domain-containing protein n=1 Tax=Vibrio sp. SCSIO 43136 TaxID=2819101 RepID=UPI002074FD7F|nr:DUF3624 domain-containing protein [Vibrio sp. SCSIO 43136]USD66606.1 DUF3624 domain-containing protein [Vibrio sp. SCSIO 43136]
MSCQNCQSNWFWKKIGRCHRCMVQLAVLSLICWPTWWWLYRETPTSVESIGLFMTACAFSGLLLLHLVMKFLVIKGKG